MTEASTEIAQNARNSSRRYRKAAALIEKWMAEQGTYDEETWPALEEELNNGGARCGESDEPSA